MLRKSVYLLVAVYCVVPVLSAKADGTQSSGAATIVEAPCALTEEASRSGPTAGLRTCAAFLNGEGGNPGFLANLKSVLTIHVDKMLSTQTGTGIQMCALVQNPLVLRNGQPFAEERTNRLGQSCGNPMTISVRTRPLVVQFHKYPPATGTLEDGWISGAQAQAIAYYHAQISKKIAAEKKLAIGNYSQGPSYVAGLAADYQKEYDDRNNLFNELSKRSDARELLAAVHACAAAAKKGDAAAATFGVGQQAAQLCSAQMSLERAYLNLIAGEILGKAQDAHFKALGSSTAYQAMLQWIRDRMKMVCKDAGQSGASRCYSNNIASNVREYLSNVWPVAQLHGATTTTAQVEFSTPWFLMAAGLLPRRRSRSKKTVRSLRRLLRPIFLSALVVLYGAVIGACKKESVNINTPTEVIQPNERCPGNFSQYKIECCSNGVLCTSTSIAGCTVTCTDPNTIDVPRAVITEGTNDLSSVHTSNSNVASLFGLQRDAVNGANATGDGIRSAALAGTKTTGISNSNADGETPNGDASAGKAGEFIASNGTPSADMNAGGSSPNIFGGNSGNSNSLNPMSGGGAGDSSLGANAGASGADAKAAGAGAGKTTYAGGGGGKDHGGGDKVDPSSFFGDHGGRDPANQDTNFAQDGDGKNPMGTADPDDYFTRVGLGDSIFKIVSRRYRAKAFSWAMVQSQANFHQATQATQKK